MWQRWNSGTKIFEKSDDNGGVWTPLGLDAAIITQGSFARARLDGQVAYKDEANVFLASGNRFEQDLYIRGAVGSYANLRLAADLANNAVDIVDLRMNDLGGGFDIVVNNGATVAANYSPSGLVAFPEGIVTDDLRISAANFPALILEVIPGNRKGRFYKRFETVTDISHNVYYDGSFRPDVVGQPGINIEISGSDILFQKYSGAGNPYTITDNLLLIDVDALHAYRGIRFPAAQIASANVNHLDDYEEGSYALASTGITFVAGYDVGYYTKIGRQVTINFTMQAATSNLSAATGFTLPLPFVASAPVFAANMMTTYAIVTGNIGFSGYVPNGSSTLNFLKVNNGGSWVGATNADVPVGAHIIGSFSYMTST